MNYRVEYAMDDLLKDIVSKNKLNIIDLYLKLSQQPTQDDLDKVNKLLGSYAIDDANGFLDSNESVIRNLVIVKDNLTAALKRIQTNEETISRHTPIITDNTKRIGVVEPIVTDNTKRIGVVEPIVTDNTKRIGVIEPIVTDNTKRIGVVEPIVTANTAKGVDNATRLDKVEPVVEVHTNEIRKLQTAGIGNYKGTFKGVDGDDISALPTPALQEERAIVEFPVGDEIKYQEFKWDNGGWIKWGDVTDSHIHSQSAGISLADVSNQQDPKIALKLDKATFNLYEEKVITIPQELSNDYELIHTFSSGTYQITDLATKPNDFEVIWRPTGPFVEKFSVLPVLQNVVLNDQDTPLLTMEVSSNGRLNIKANFNNSTVQIYRRKVKTQEQTFTALVKK